jgi:hypothetical protein
MMKNYTVYFEIFGKKMKTKILAESKENAEQQIKDKIIFHKVVVDEQDEFNKAVNILDSINDILSKNKPTS